MYTEGQLPLCYKLVSKFDLWNIRYTAHTLADALSQLWKISLTSPILDALLNYRACIYVLSFYEH